MNKIDKSLENLPKMRKKKSQISKIRNEKGKITRNIEEIQGIIRHYFTINWKILKKWTNF
jgi:hypothetical protein